MPEMNDRDGLLGFDITDVKLFSFSQFMEKTEIRNKTVSAA